MADPSVLRAELLRRLKEGESCRLVLGPCPAELLADEELMLKCLEFNAYVVEYLPAELLEKREIWLRAAKQNFNVLRRCPALLLDDKEFALQLVEVEPMSLKFLKGNDKEVVLHALEGSGLALEFADDSLRADRDVVRKAVQKDGLAHAFASEDLRRDEELALAALKSSTAVIRILPESLSRSMSFLLQAANAGGSSILRFLPEYAADKVFVQHVLKFDCTALAHCPQLMHDPNLQLAALEAGGAQGAAALELAPKELREDRSFLLRAARISPQVLRLAPEELQRDRSFVLEAVRARGAALQFAPFEHRNDPQLVMEAVKQDLGALAFADTSLRNNGRFKEEIALLQQAIHVT